MAVRVGERSESRLQVLNAARKLAEYTIRQCQSERVFPKKARWVMANRMVNECLDACSCIKAANSYPLEERCAIDRESYQRAALARFETMLMLLDIAYGAFGIDGRKIEYWTGLVVEAQKLCRAWMKSDRERLG